MKIRIAGLPMADVHGWISPQGVFHPDPDIAHELRMAEQYAASVPKTAAAKRLIDELISTDPYELKRSGRTISRKQWVAAGLPPGDYKYVDYEGDSFAFEFLGWAFDHGWIRIVGDGSVDGELNDKNLPWTQKVLQGTSAPLDSEITIEMRNRWIVLTLENFLAANNMTQVARFGRVYRKTESLITGILKDEFSLAEAVELALGATV